jgi:hypothetical protein
VDVELPDLPKSAERVTTSTFTLADLDARIVAIEVAFEWVMRCIAANSDNPNDMSGNFSAYMGEVQNDVRLFGINSLIQGNEPASGYADLVAESIRGLKERVVEYLSVPGIVPSRE